MVLEPPDGDLQPSMPGMAGGRVMVPFARGIQNDGYVIEVFSIYDAQTGEHLIDYRKPESLQGAFSCYASGDIFTFISLGEDGRSSRVEAGPR
jgi:hypothetical protein